MRRFTKVVYRCVEIVRKKRLRKENGDRQGLASHVVFSCCGLDYKYAPRLRQESNIKTPRRYLGMPVNGPLGVA